jgi:hypothetical protein
MLAVRTPGAPQTAREDAVFDSAFPFERQGRLLRSRSISGLYSRSLHSGLQPPCLRFAATVTGRHARLRTRPLARLYRGRHLRRQTSTRLQGATPTDPGVQLARTGLSPEVGRDRRSGLGRPIQFRSARRCLLCHTDSGAVSGACFGITTSSSGRVPSLHILRRCSPQLCSDASTVVWTRPTPRAFPDSFVSSTSCRGPGRKLRLRAARGLPGSSAIRSSVMWP